MATVTGQMIVNRTAASTDAAAQASGEMLLAAQTANTGHEEISDPADGTGLMQFNTRAINGLMRIVVNT